PADASGGAPVPVPNPAQRHGQRRAQVRVDFGQGPLTLVPRVAERRVAIADVYGVGARPDSVREGAARRDDQVELANGQALDRPRIEGKQTAKAPLADA